MFGSLFHSFVLAQIFGLYMLIMAIVMLSRVNYYREVIQGIQPHTPIIPISAASGLMLGLFLVIIHNIWVMEPRVIVTLICWFILIKSVLWLAIPEHMLTWAKRTYAGSGYYIIAVIMAVLGILMMTKGFYLFI